MLPSLNPLTWLSVGLGLIVTALLILLAGKNSTINSLKLEHAQYVQVQTETALEKEREFKEKLELQIQTKQQVEERYEQALADTNSSLDSALKRLRVAQASARTRKPAEAAPAECRSYEAPPSQLSLEDREFLVRIGAEADALAQQVISLQDYINEVILK